MEYGMRNSVSGALPTHPLRIIFVAPFGLGQKTTVWARTLPLARVLAGHGHQVSILIPPWDTPTDAERGWDDGGVEVVNVALGGGALLIVGRLLHEINRRQPHLVHIVKPRAYAGLVQWWLWQKRGLGIGHWALDQGAIPNTQYATSTIKRFVPKIFLDLDDWEQAWAPINRYSWPLMRFLAWQEEWGIRHADGITAASRWLEHRVKQYAPDTPVLYLPNGIDEGGIKCGDRRAPQSAEWSPNVTPHSALRTPNSEFRILFFTRFIEVKPEWLAGFWGVLQSRLSAVRLIVAGSALQPGLEEQFKDWMARANPAAAGQVEWLGYVPGDQLPALYATVDCAIFPAMEIPLLQAKCSVKLATTLLQGVPVVASAVGEQTGYGAQGAALLVDPAAAPAQFAEAVTTLLQQPECQRAMIQAAQRHLYDHYRWVTLGEQLHEFYQQLA